MTATKSDPIPSIDRALKSHNALTISFLASNFQAFIMGNFCGGGEVATSNDQIIISSRKPPLQCEGYSPAMMPTFLKQNEIVDFFLQYQNANETRQLACGLVRCMDDIQNRSSWTWVQSSFDIDSTKPVIILCHGHLAWRNQMLIAFLAANLSRKLNCHTLRFDFSGNGHSKGTWRYGGFDSESQDLEQVIRFVREQLKCQVSCVIGHSKGAFAVMKRAWEQEDMPPQAQVPSFVNLCGLYYQPGKYKPEERFTKEQLVELESNGKFLLETRGSRRFEVTRQDIQDKINADSSLVRGITTSRVLLIHGDADEEVPVSSARKFSKAIQTSELHIIKGGDHAFNGLKFMDELSDRISVFVRK